MFLVIFCATLPGKESKNASTGQSPDTLL